MEVVPVELLTPVLTGVLLALFTAIQAWINRGRFDALERHLDTLEERVERRFEQIANEIAQLRSDLLQVALSARPHHQTG